LENIPTANIRSAAQGYIELKGRAKPLLNISYTTPFVHKPCVYFEYEYFKGGVTEGDRFIERSMNSFLIDDRTGTCRIDPPHINVITRKSKRTRTKLANGMTIVAVRWIEINEKIYVYGDFTTLHVNYHQQASDLFKTKLKLLKSDHELLKKFDLNNDGTIDAKEWTVARAHIKEEVNNYIIEKQKQHKEQAQEHVIKKPNNTSLPFLLSCYEELAIIKRYRLYAFLGLVLFFYFGVDTVLHFKMTGTILKDTIFGDLFV